MKIYVAGKFEDKETVNQIYKKIIDRGYEVSYDWTTHQKAKPYKENVRLIQTYAENEIKAISFSNQ